MEAHESLSSQFLAFVDLLSKTYGPLLEQTGLTRLRWGILHLAQEQAPLTMSELTRLIELPKSNVTYHVDWLEASGYLTREPSTHDRRVTYLAVTPKGAAIVQQVPDAIKQLMAEFAQRVTPEELALMEAGFRLFVSRWPQMLSEETGALAGRGAAD